MERKNGVLKQQIRRLISETTLVEWTEVLAQALIFKIHLNKPGLLPDWGSPLKHPIPLKVWKSWELAIAPTLTVDQHAMLLRTLSPILMVKGIIYWNLQ